MGRQRPAGRGPHGGHEFRSLPRVVGEVAGRERDVRGVVAERADERLERRAPGRRLPRVPGQRAQQVEPAAGQHFAVVSMAVTSTPTGAAPSSRRGLKVRSNQAFSGPPWRVMG